MGGLNTAAGRYWLLVLALVSGGEAMKMLHSKAFPVSFLRSEISFHLLHISPSEIPRMAGPQMDGLSICGPAMVVSREKWLADDEETSFCGPLIW
jgi:hypothetical protein